MKGKKLNTLLGIVIIVIGIIYNNAELRNKILSYFHLEELIKTEKPQKQGKKDKEITNKENVNSYIEYNKKSQVNNNEENSFVPKGNRKEYCQINTYQGQLPLVSKGFNNKNKQNELIELCYHGYTALFKNEYNISLWVAEKLTPEREKKARGGEREPSFYPDPTILKITGDAVNTKDYIGANDGNGLRYDRGHLAPSRDMELSDRYESFYMSNIVPQSANNNRNVWADIEKTARCLAVNKKTEVYTVTVPAINLNYYINNKKPLPVLKTKRNLTINIPDYMAKAIYIPKTNEIAVYLTKNDKSKINYELISVNKLKEISFIDVFPQLNEELKNKVSKMPKPGKCY